MRILGLLLLTIIGTACNASTADIPAAVAAAPKLEDPELAEHRRLMAEHAKFQKRFLATLPKMEVERLYYIDPMADREKILATDQIQGYAILSRARVSAAQSSSGALQDSLRKIIESTPEYAAACFDPHHVATLSDGKEEFDAVVCFDCGRYRIFSPKGDWLLSGSFDVSEEATWDKVFTTAGLRRPPHNADH